MNSPYHHLTLARDWASLDGETLALPERLSEVAVSVLVITGDDDHIVPTAESVRLAGEPPRAELVVFPNCGHVPQEECPEAFLGAVKTFLQGHVGSSGRP